MCWTEIGYATGFVSGLFGQMVVFREVECRGMGHASCRVVGKTSEQWGDVERDLSYLRAVNSPAPVHSAPTPAASYEASPPTATDQPLVGASAAFNAASQALQRVAMTPATVLISGESGVGKEMFARQLHQLSRNREGPFVALNCAAIPDNLIEAELFGVERGAYTGATHSRPGRFERANGGTLFLDEITSLSLAGQSKLLRALQEREIERVGGHGIKVNVRVVAATNVDLRKAVAAGDFREDLFYRLNVYPIALPPLRERRDDIPLLINFFLKRFCQEYGRTPAGLTMRALKTLLGYDFAGNVRELQNLIERGLIASDEGQAIDTGAYFPQRIVTAGRLLAESPRRAASGIGCGCTAGTCCLAAGLLNQPDQAFSIDGLEQRLIQRRWTRAKATWRPPRACWA